MYKNFKVLCFDVSSVIYDILLFSVNLNPGFNKYYSTIIYKRQTDIYRKPNIVEIVS